MAKSEREILKEMASNRNAEGNPFPGLRPFSIDESHLFFGREGQSDEVLLKLSKNRFVGIIGPSGSGKSSFIYCGVLPILYGGFLTETGPNWEVVVTRPGAGPIENLAEAILGKDAEYAVADTEDKQIKKTIITTLLKSSSLGLVEALTQFRGTSDKNYLILVDQFEELFRFKESQLEDSRNVNETLGFINLLVEAINYSELPIYVAITMRSDFIGECAQFPELTKKINDSHYLIPQMTREQKRRAIVGPVAVGGAKISQRLVQKLLNDLGDSTDQLPILQHALMRTWGYWSEYGSQDEDLDLKHYEAIGQMAEALSMHANEAYDELTESQKRICEILFKATTEKRGENFGIRRPTRLGEIAAIADVPEEEVIEVVEKFREPGRSLLTPPFGVPLSSRSMVDISHESLMRIWVRLKNWVDDEAEAVQMYLRLSDAAALHQVGKGGLWRPPDLQLALNWQQKHNPTLVWGQRYHPAFERTMVFLDYSRREFETEQKIKELQQKRALRRARITALILATATVISIGFLLFAFAQQAEAEAQRDLAKLNELKAIENAKEAEKQTEIAKNQTDIALEEKRLADIARDQATEARLIAEDAKNEAVRQAGIAAQQRDRAEESEKTALQREREANEARRAEEAQRLEAERRRLEAEKLRMLAIAKSMAIKSVQLRSEQATLKGLLAQQAYEFNETYDGLPYEYDIYDGLYNAIKELGDPLVNSLDGHRKGVRAMTASTTGNVIYSADTEGKILRWTLSGEVRNADTIAYSRGTAHVVRAMAISHDNRTMIAGGEFAKSPEGTTFVEIYNLAQPGAAPTLLSGFKDAVWKVVADRSNSNRFFVLDNGGMSIRKVEGNQVTEVISAASRINTFDLSHDGKYLITGTNNGKVMLYDVNKNFQASEIYSTKGVTINAIGFDVSSYKLALGDGSGLVRIFTLFSNQPVRRLVGHTSPINEIQFSANGEFLGSASRDRTVRLWITKDLNAQPIVLSDHPDWVWNIVFTPDNQQILAGTNENIIRAWPTDINTMANKICSKISRNMTPDEWERFVAEDIEYQNTCKGLPVGEAEEED